jgi:hypothetical protein
MRCGIGQPAIRKKDPRFLTARAALSRTSICHARRTRSSSFLYKRADPRSEQTAAERVYFGGAKPVDAETAVAPIRIQGFAGIVIDIAGVV